MAFWPQSVTVRLSKGFDMSFLLLSPESEICIDPTRELWSGSDRIDRQVVDTD